MYNVTGSDEERYQILFGSDICDPEMTDKTKGYLDRLMEIDSEVYGGEDKGEDCVYVGDVSGYISRFGYVEKDGKYVLDPNSGCVDNIVCVAKGGKILGYINYLTMDDELYHEILHPDIEAYLEDPSRRDDGIEGSQLRQWQRGGDNNLFILSTSMDKQYQDGEAIKVLTNAFLDELRKKEQEGYHINSMTADTVSDHGEDIARMFRLANVPTADGKDLILPAPESDESGHYVTVRCCDGENMEKLLQYGFDFDRDRLARTKREEITRQRLEMIQEDGSYDSGGTDFDLEALG